MKKVILVTLISMIFGVSHAQVIVHDPTSFARMAEQLAQMKMQLEQAKQLFNNLNGLRDIGGLMQGNLSKTMMPASYQKMFNELKRGGGNGGVSGSLDEITKLYQTENCSKQYKDPNGIKNCQLQWQNQAMNQYVGERGYDMAQQNIEDLGKYVEAIKSSPDAKSVQDLQARIAVEQLRLQNETLKLQTIQMMQQAQKEMRQKNAAEGAQRNLRTSAEKSIVSF